MKILSKYSLLFDSRCFMNSQPKQKIHGKRWDWRRQYYEHLALCWECRVCCKNLLCISDPLNWVKWDDKIFKIPSACFTPSSCFVCGHLCGIIKFSVGPRQGLVSFWFRTALIFTWRSSSFFKSILAAPFPYSQSLPQKLLRSSRAGNIF